jgi:hypothetical protein
MTSHAQNVPIGAPQFSDVQKPLATQIGGDVRGWHRRIDHAL